MAKKKETYFKEKVLKELKALRGVWAYKANQRSLRGIPDIIMCVKGDFWGIELKKDAKSKPDPLQLFVLETIETKAGGSTMVVWPEVWDEFFRAFKNQYDLEPKGH